MGSEDQTGGLEADVDIVLDDVDYVVSDTHFQHLNVIKFGRKAAFDVSWQGVSRMSARILGNWNRKVNKRDKVLFLGDLVMGDDRYDQTVVNDYWNALNGDKTFIRGDHDHRKPDSVDDLLYTAKVHHEGRAFLAAHYPGDGMVHAEKDGTEYLGTNPDDDMTILDHFKSEFKQRYPTAMYDRREDDTWIIHGHHHNCHPALYPHINPDRRTINVSIETPTTNLFTWTNSLKNSTRYHISTEAYNALNRTNQRHHRTLSTRRVGDSRKLRKDLQANGVLHSVLEA